MSVNSNNNCKTNGHRFNATTAETRKSTWVTYPFKGNRVTGRPAVNKRDTSLPPTKANGHLVSPWKPSDDGNYTVYRYEGNHLQATDTHQSSKKRQQSLPPRKQDHAGISTQARDLGYNRSKEKFATSWAKAQVKNSTEADDSEERKRAHRQQQSNKENKTQKHKNENKSQNNKHSAQKKDNNDNNSNQHGRDHRNTVNKQKDIFHASSSSKEQITSNETSPVLRKSKISQSKEHSAETYNDKTTAVVSPDSDAENRPKTHVCEWKCDWRTDFRNADPPVHVSERERRRQERELTYKPTITDSKDIYKAYIGFANRKTKSEYDRSRTSHSDSEFRGGKTPGSSEKEHVLNPRETHSWIKMHSVYGSHSYKKQRKECFIDKLTKAEFEMIKQNQLELKEKERRRNESKIRQQRQLMFVRKRFQEQQWRRFRTQYVTSRVLEHELMNRHDYGLPEAYGEDTGNNPKPRRKKQPNITSFDENKAKEKYERKFKQLFDYNGGPSWNASGKTPKMEGIDVIVVEVQDDQGNVKQQKKDVKKIIREAENAISDSTTSEAADKKNKSKPRQQQLTPGYSPSRGRNHSDSRSGDTSQNKSSRSQSWGRASLDSLDLDDVDDDDDDIFERARRKYNLSVGDDDDVSSRRLN